MFGSFGAWQRWMSTSDAIVPGMSNNADDGKDFFFVVMTVNLADLQYDKIALAGGS